jgi:hypothetical protein
VPAVGLEPAVSWPWWLRLAAERLGLAERPTGEEQFRADPLVRLAAELMDPLYGLPVPPGLSAAELRALAESSPFDSSTGAARSSQLPSTRGASMLRTQRSAARERLWQPGFAVRRDWPDGVHEFVGFRLTEGETALFLVGDYEYWRKGPMRPVHSLVVIGGRDFELHHGRRDCRSPDCPVTELPVSECEAMPQ